MAKSTAKSARTRPGTYFLSLTVENVRCFGPEQTLDLSNGEGRHAQWTVILGENGVGKTTVLVGLAAMAQMWPVVGEGAELEAEVRRLHRSMLGLTGFLRLSMSQGGFRGVVRLSEKQRETLEIKIRIQGSNILVNKAVPQLVCFHYGASRRMPQGRSLVGYDEPSGIFLDGDIELRDPEDWLLRADYNVHLRGGEDKQFDAFARRVREALVGILPEVSEIRIQPADEPQGSPRVEAKTPDGWLPLRRLGFGYQSQIAWLIDFASRMFERYPQSSNPLTEPAVVLVDEIDLHMHPRWQRQVISYLTELCPKTQFIVTAHSPLVVQAAKGANIVLLRREGDHVVIDNDPEVLDNWRVDQILTSELFGLESARPPQIEAQLEERRTLLAKPRLTSRDRGRLATLEAEIGDLPAGENAEDRRAMDLIREIAGKLKSGA